MGDVHRTEESERIGGMAGMGAGMLAGARLGSSTIPIPFVGTVAGAVVGGVVGTEAGKRLGRAVWSGAEAFVRTLTAETGSAGAGGGEAAGA